MSLATQITALAQRIAQEVKPASRTAAMDRGRALRAFRGSYLGGSSAAPTDIAIVGASFEEGYGTTLMTNGWTHVFRDVLRGYAQPKGLAGGGSVPASNTSYQAGVGNYYGFNPALSFAGGAYPDDPQIASTGTFTAVPTLGLGLRAIIAPLNATKTFEWFGTGADFMYTTTTTWGSFTWAVDGGSATVVNTAVATSYGQRVQIRGLARGRHTLTVTCTVAGTGGTGCVWEGIAFYDGDESSGIRVWQAAHGGYAAQYWVAGTGNTAWVNSFTTWNWPDLVILNLGYNDWKTGRTSAQIKTDLESIITLIRARATILGVANPSMVLMSSFSIIQAGSAHVEPWSNVVDAYYTIAAADDDVCVFDYQHWFGKDSETTATTRGGILVSDGLHPNDSGAAIIGGAMAEFVLDSSERMRDLRRFGVAPADPSHNASVASQGAGFATDTYLTGSNTLITLGRQKPGMKYVCRFKATKTAAGIATPIIQVRLGTAGTIADTSRVTLTAPAQTAATDDAWIEVFVTFRTVGAATVLQASLCIDHENAVTGFSTLNNGMADGTSASFDSTTATQIGISVNGGTSAAWTVTQVDAELKNAA